jgi:hypothetical protein
LYALPQKQIVANYVASFIDSFAERYSLSLDDVRTLIVKKGLIGDLVDNYGYYHMYDTKDIIETDFKKYIEQPK